MNKWTVPSAELMEIVLRNPDVTQEEIGKRLGIKQNSVSGRWNRAYVNEILEVERMYRKRLKIAGMIIIIKLLLAHFIGFIIQPNAWVAEKERIKAKSLKLYLHGLDTWIVGLAGTLGFKLLVSGPVGDGFAYHY